MRKVCVSFSGRVTSQVTANFVTAHKKSCRSQMRRAHKKKKAKNDVEFGSGSPNVWKRLRDWKECERDLQRARRRVSTHFSQASSLQLESSRAMKMRLRLHESTTKSPLMSLFCARHELRSFYLSNSQTVITFEGKFTFDALSEY